jgi:hypothetical protein
MIKLPVFKDDSKNLMLLQNVWTAILNPLLGTPQINTTLLKNIDLSVGTNQINHKLGRKLQGWYIVRQRADANIYDNQDNNQNPELTLTLISSNQVSVDLVVF